MDLEPGRASGDRQALIAELPDDVERLARRLLQRDSQLILRNCALDFGAHVRRGFEEAIRRHEAVERLVRALEVVVADVVRKAVLRVLHVREDRTAQKLVPQRLPEALDLAERLRMLWAAADVLDAQALQRLFEFGLAAPHRVLPAVVGQHFSRIAVRGEASLKRLHHERGLLMVRKRVAHDEAAVVVHEHAYVQPLGTPQTKREDVRLPQLVRRRAFEAAGAVFTVGRRRR